MILFPFWHDCPVRCYFNTDTQDFNTDTQDELLTLE